MDGGYSEASQRPLPFPALSHDEPLTCPAVSQSWSLTGRPSTDTTAEKQDKNKDQGVSFNPFQENNGFSCNYPSAILGPLMN